MSFIDTCIRRPVLAWMIMAGCVLFGGIALSRIGVSQYPDVDFPVVSVNVTWEGAAPELVDVELVDVIEEALTQVEGVRDIRSTARRGTASITVEMHLGRDIDTAMQEVQSRIAQVQRRLPRDIDPPVVSKQNPEDQPIMWLSLSGPFAPQVLADWTRYRVKERFQVIPGVGEVTLGGYRERNVRVWLDVDRLDQHGVTANEVVDAIGRQHLELPGGALKAGGREVSVRVLGEAFDLDQLGAVVVGGPAAAPVRLSDVALVEDGFEDLTRMNRVDGLPAQGIGIRKQRGANAVAVGVGRIVDVAVAVLVDAVATGVGHRQHLALAEAEPRSGVEAGGDPAGARTDPERRRGAVVAVDRLPGGAGAGTRREVPLAAVARVVVAVLEAGVAGGELALTVAALDRRVGQRGARLAAAAAVEGAREDVE
ncbi:MAG: efflux RND transporter permease subunit, partial [Planctomycetes bacterium]|nr:efflux RND transporter permease subunit [Planctomycetota bacterium]